jgi:hypothetical protein
MPTWQETAPDNFDFNSNGGEGFDVNNVVNRAADVLGSIFSHSPYVSPDDPRYQGQRGGYYPQPVYGAGGGQGAGVNVSATPHGIGAGVNLSTNTLLLIGAGVLLFLFGQKKGRG